MASSSVDNHPLATDERLMQQRGLTTDRDGNLVPGINSTRNQATLNGRPVNSGDTYSNQSVVLNMNDLVDIMKHSGGRQGPPPVAPPSGKLIINDNCVC